MSQKNAVHHIFLINNSSTNIFVQILLCMGFHFYGKMMLILILMFLTTGINLYSQYNNAPVIANDTCKTIDNYLSQLEKEKNFSGGLLIVKNGKKIFSKGYGWADKENKIPFTSTTLASMGSITKAFTAAAIMKLVEENKLSLNDPIKKFFPYAPADKANVTIHQLLTHSSGFHEFLQNDGGDYEVIDSDAFIKRAFTEPLAFTPGEKAVYTNVGMSILGIIIEQVSGLDYEAFLQQKLFAPAGIKNIGYHVAHNAGEVIAHGYQNGKDWGTIPAHIAAAGNQPYWNLKANGGLEISLDDMFLWANAITNNTVLSKASTDKMFTPQILEEGYNDYFGYGCNIGKTRRNTKLIDNGGSNGIYFARLIRLPDEGLVFYLITNESSINANMVLPNVTQLYFTGQIAQDATQMQHQFEDPMSKMIYEIVLKPETKDLKEALAKENITVNDDLILLDVGQKLIEEKNTDKALILYKYYTSAFPNIVVAWNDMGDVYLMRGNKEEAKKCYMQALKIRPENARAKESLQRLGE